MLMKLTPDKFHQHFLHVQIPKAQKNAVKLSVFFVLFGSAHVKAACKMLMKLTPDKFHQYFMQSFYMHRSQEVQKNAVKLSVFFVLLGSGHVKAACKMLEKLTPGRSGSDD